MNYLFFGQKVPKPLMFRPMGPKTWAGEWRCRRGTILLAVCLSLASACHATFYISGRVLNARGDSVPGVYLVLSPGSGPRQAAYTDAQGFYKFTEVLSGSCVITPQTNSVFSTSLGFTPSSRQFESVDSSQTGQDFILPTVTASESRNSNLGDTIDSCFDGVERTFYCSAAINPAYVQVEFPTARPFTAVGIIPGAYGQPYMHDWWLEAADSEDDLNTRTGSYLMVVSTNYHSDYFRWAREWFPEPVTRKLWRAGVRALEGSYVHLSEFKLEDEPVQWATATGTVRGSRGQTIAGALVSAFNLDDKTNLFHAVSQSDGSFSSRVTAGRYLISASLPGYYPSAPMTTVLSNDQAVLSIVVHALPSSSNAFYVLLNAALVEPLEPSLQVYTNDVAQQGLEPVVIPMLADAPQTVRRYLQTAHMLGMQGLLLVGDFPMPMWEEAVPGGQYCPSDLFYMDLDGVWEDTDGDDCYDRHTGRRGPEIFMGRLKASNLKLAPTDNEVDLLKNYFRKVHAYRVHELFRPFNSACLFVDQDWAHCIPDYRSWITEAFPNITEVRYPDTTGPNYVRCLTNDYELLQIHSHASPGGHALEGGVSVEEVRASDPHALFYVIWGCSTADLRSDNYLAGWYPFSASSALLSIGESFSSGIASLELLYHPLAQGLSWGVSCQRKFSPDGETIIGTESYAQIFSGDPTLRIQSARPPQMVRMEATLTRTNQVRVTWRAITASHVNIKDYRLQYCAQGPVPGQVDDESWTDLVTNSPDTEYVFSGTPGTTYTFRCSGTDYVRSTSAFMESGPVEIPAEDSDKDGLPDWWETYYFAQEDAVPAEDPDKDGASNVNEFVAHTHPREAQDSLRVTECRISREGTSTCATISWTSKPTCSYALLWATNLIQPAWEETGLGLISPDGTVTQRKIECPGGTQRFFRVEVRKSIPQLKP